MNRIIHNLKYAKQLFLRIGILLLVYQICRLLFFTMNYSIFSGSSFFDIILSFIYGLRFDISAIFYLNSLFILLHIIPWNLRVNRIYQYILKGLFYVVNIAALGFIIADLEFYKFSFRRTTIDITGYYSDFMNLLPQFIRDFWYLGIIWALLIVLTELLYRKTGLAHKDKKSNPFIQMLVFILITGIIVIGARGGLQPRPLTPSNAYNMGKVELAPLINNTPFNILYSLSHKKLSRIDYFPENRIVEYFQHCKTNEFQSEPVMVRDTGKPNVVLIIMESFSKEFMGLYGAEKTATPFLDSIGEVGLTFTNMHGNGTRSVEGIPAILASVPSLSDEYFMHSIYQANRLNGLGNMLKNQGYQTAFFHGGINGTFNLDAFTRKTGFDGYHGMNEYGNDKDFDGNWGIFDGPFFQYTANELDRLQPPFCAGLFSLSSHHPYTLPKGFEDQVADEPDIILKSVRYADNALKKFFETASTKSWYNNTVFIITADHRSGHSGDKYVNTYGHYGLPLIVFRPGITPSRKMDYTVQQADIMPGILDYLGISDPYCSFGQSFLRPGLEHFAIQYNIGYYQLIYEPYTYRLHKNGKENLFNHTTDFKYEKDISLANPQITQKLGNQLKAIIQVYHNSMIGNTMSYDIP